MPMLKLLRLALLVVLVFLALGMVIAITSSTTGPFEKVVLAAVLVGVFAAGVPVRRIGESHS
jgi:hypothetical protein